MLPFGETVLAWRMARGLTQAQLARAARIPRPNLSAIESGAREVTLRTLRALALALGVRPGVLADGVSPRAGAAPLDRTALERVAEAAVGARDVADPRQAELARHVRAVLAPSASARRTGRRRSARRADLAYFLLKISESPETIASLIGRARERTRPG